MSSTTNNKISIKNAQEILDNLVNKEIHLSCGYGGVMFIEIDSITKKYGNYRLFCDENWTFSDGKNLHLDRWTSSSSKVDDLFESLGVCKLEKVEIINNFEKTVSSPEITVPLATIF